MTTLGGLCSCALPMEPLEPVDGEPSQAPRGKADDGRESAGRELTLATFNLEFFGSTTSGPIDERVQTENAAEVIATVLPDVVGLQEISDFDWFDELKDELPQYEFLSSADGRVEGAWRYTSESPTYLALGFRRDRCSVISARTIPDVVWGRAPLEVALEVQTAGGPQRLIVVVVHLAPYAWPDRRELRQTQANALKAYLDRTHPDELVAVVGDWNDDVDESTAPGLPSPFDQFWDDPSYYFPTFELSMRNQATTVDWPSTIDHHLVSDELWQHYVAGSAWVERPDYIADYRETTSDHYLVSTRYAFDE